MDYEDYMEEVKSFAFVQDDSQEHSPVDDSSPSVSDSLNMTLSEPEKVPQILNGEYFQVIGETKNSDTRNRIIVAVCQLCTSRRTIRGSGNVTSNFIQHLKKQHPIQYEEYVGRRRKSYRRSKKFEHVSHASYESKADRTCLTTMVDPLSATESIDNTASYSSSAPPSEEHLPTIFNGKYFRILEESEGQDPATSTVVAVCQICGTRKWIHGTHSRTSNFVRHLKTAHPLEYAEYFQENNNKRIKSEHNDSGIVDTSPTIHETYITPSYPYEHNSIATATYNPDTSSETDGAPTIINGKYFKIVSQNADYSSNSVTVACQMCTPTKLVRGMLGVSSNFLRHLKDAHPLQYEEYLLEKKIAKKDRNLRISYSSFDERVLRFIVDTHSPVQIVEQPSFLRLFEGTELRVNRSKNMLNMLNEKFNMHWEILKDTLRLVPYVCVTADIWTTNRDTFFGYACHWIDANLKRQSAVLACSRQPGRRAMRNIGNKLANVNAHFELSEQKIMYSFTENGGNFLAIYKEAENRELNNDDCDANERLNFIPFPTELKAQLPKQASCCCYGINLLATQDYNNILRSNATVNEMHEEALERCFSIWHKCRDDIAVERAHQLLHSSLKVPHATSWNSLFISLSDLLAHKTSLDELCTALQVAPFRASHIEYLEEYCCLMKPIGEALTFLQQEENMYYGYFLPTLITIKIKLQKLQANNTLKYLGHAVGALKNALIKRFRGYFELHEHCHDALVAAMSCPSIKLKFLPALKDIAPNLTQDSMSEIFINYAKEFETTNSGSDEGKGASTSGARAAADAASSFFDFSPNDDALIEQQKHSLYRMRLQLLQYLEDIDCSRYCLERYPVIRKVFVKYNTPLPSAAAVERLFALDNDVHDQLHRQNLSSQLFERMTVLKANKAC